MTKVSSDVYLGVAFFIGAGVACVVAAFGFRKIKKKANVDSDTMSLMQAQQKALIDSIDDLAWLKDKESRFILVNRKFAQVFGLEPNSLIGKTDFDLSANELAQRYQKDDQDVMFLGKPKRHEERISLSAGEIGWSETIKVPVLDVNGDVVGTAGVARDITERRKAQEQMELLANSDALTGLGNRTYLEHRFQEFLQHHASFAILFLDLDNFKLINDTDGHAVGDKLLVLLAERLRHCVDPESALVRLGGDEFLIMLPGISEQEAVEAIAQRVGKAVAETYTICDASFAISTSIGIVKFPEHGRDQQTLIKHADLAMYQAKKAGRNRFHWFTDELANHSHVRRSIESRLREALAEGKFELHYQPIIDLKTQRIMGAEALLRMMDLPNEQISPSIFIPVAEESSLILPIGDWILRSAIAQLRQWNLQGHDIVLSINISGIQFQKADFVDDIVALLTEFDVPAHQLELELTEGVLMENVDSNLHMLHRIKKIGVRLAVDDFGTGYSSLSYLKHLPIDRLKIDRSFVFGLPEHEGDVAITRSIINIALAFQLQVTAEGIEEPKHQEFLQSLGCQNAQGFLYSKAVPVEEFDILLKESMLKAAASAI